MTSDHGDWLDQAHPKTQAIRAGIQRGPEGEHAEPIFTTSSYVFASARDAAERFGGDVAGNVYSRYTNPTVRSFEQRLASLEGGEAAVATASGMAAILTMCMSLLKAGDHVICSQDVFGSTVGLFKNYLAKLGIEISYAPLRDLQAWRDSCRATTKLFFCESPSNPLCEIGDIPALASVAHDAGAVLAVDNCFCTPALQRPLAMGADLVIHSATKYLDGQGRVLGGAVVGKADYIESMVAFIRTCGPSLSPFNAWVLLKGLETLALRMSAHSANAAQLADWLQHRAEVTRVNYAGLVDHPGHALAAQQQSDYGPVLSFVVDGGRDAAWRFIDATELMSLTANLGDVKTTIVHPATTTHSRLNDAERKTAGISDGLIRIAVGLEHIDDIRADCERGFAALNVTAGEA